jgi:ribonuclease BN (tRNA processing enzyme)
MFNVLMTGVGDAFSTQHWGTHFVIQKGDFLLGIDCPDSYRRALAESGFEHDGERLDAQHLDAMVLTHLHGDHVNGLEMTACYMRFVHERKLKLYTQPDSARDLWPRLRTSLNVLWDGQTFHEQRLDDFFDLEVLDWESTTQIGPLTITTRATKHHIPAMAMRVSDGTHTLGYSCDTAYDPELIDWLSGADLIIHESSLGPAHTPLFKLMELPEPIQRKMLVVHYPDELTGTTSEGGLRLATQGSRYAVGE